MASNKKMQQLGNLLYQRYVFLVFFLVPLIMMWKVLVLDQRVHLANPGPLPKASTVTDLDGAARLTYLLSDMTFPWSQTNFVSYPVGASIWRVESLTQSLQIFLLWVFSKFFEPMFSANLLVFLGWSITGITTYLIAKSVGARTIFAIACAVALQLTPSLRFMAANFTSYVFVAIPLLAIFATIRLATKFDFKNLCLWILALGTAAVFDPYWGFFSLFGAAIYLISYFLHKSFQKRNIKYLYLSTGIFFGYLLIALAFQLVASRMVSNNLERSILIASKVDVQNSVLTLNQWLSSAYTGIGFIAMLIIVLSLVFTIVHQDSKVFALALTALAFIGISSRIPLPFLEAEINLALYVRHVMPGVRFFDRPALIAIALGLIVVSYSFTGLSIKFSIKSPVFIISSFLFLIPLTYPSLRIPETTQSAHDWALIREELTKTPHSRVLALPYTRRGRDWIEQASFQVPLVNDFVQPVMNGDVMLQASHGASTLAGYLKSIGVTHLLVVDSEMKEFLDYEFISPRFIRVNGIKLNGFGEVADFQANLYRVVPQRGDKECIDCEVGRLLKPRVQVTGDLVYPPDVLGDGRKWWWTGSGTTNIKIDWPSTSRSATQRTLSVQLSMAPCIDTLSVQIDTGHETLQRVLNSAAPTIWVPVRPDLDSAFRMTLTTDAKNCSVANDFRSFLVGVSLANT